MKLTGKEVESVLVWFWGLGIVLGVEKELKENVKEGKFM